MSRPYFETEVVKVGKSKPKLFRCRACGTILPAEKPKGNWVNGENLDAIKFPCFCRFYYEGTRYLGMLTNSGVGMHPYRLSRIDMQDNANVYRQGNSLKELIKSCRIHILKGKIIIFEEK